MDHPSSPESQCRSQEPSTCATDLPGCSARKQDRPPQARTKPREPLPKNNTPPPHGHATQQQSQKSSDAYESEPQNQAQLHSTSSATNPQQNSSDPDLSSTSATPSVTILNDL